MNNNKNSGIGLLFFIGVSIALLWPRKKKSSDAVTPLRNDVANAPVSARTTIQAPSQTIDMKNLEMLTTEVRAFNFSNVFYDHDIKSDGYKKAFNAVKPAVIRFPGGTIANFSHSDGIGYGFKTEELALANQGKMGENIQSLESRLQNNTNFHNEFIDFAKQQKFAVLYVINVFTGTVNEAVAYIKKMMNAGIKIEAFELGNELYLNAYQKQITGISDYIGRAKVFADELHKNWPSIPVLAVGNSRVLEKSETIAWNTELSKESWFDGYTLHSYRDFLANSTDFSVALKNSELYLSNNYVNAVKMMDGLMKRPLYVTEYNYLNPGVLSGGTLLQALYVSDFVITNLGIAYTNPDSVEMIVLHNMSSGDEAYSLIYKDNSVTPAYQAMSLFADINTDTCNYVVQERSGLKQLLVYDTKKGVVSQIILNLSPNIVDFEIPAFKLFDLDVKLAPIGGKSLYGNLYSGNPKSKSRQKIDAITKKTQDLTTKFVDVTPSFIDKIPPYSITQLLYEVRP